MWWIFCCWQHHPCLPLPTQYVITAQMKTRHTQVFQKLISGALKDSSFIFIQITLFAVVFPDLNESADGQYDALTMSNVVPMYHQFKSKQRQKERFFQSLTHSPLLFVWFSTTCFLSFTFFGLLRGYSLFFTSSLPPTKPSSVSSSPLPWCPYREHCTSFLL